MAIPEGVEPSSRGSNVEWGAVFAGASISTAFGFILLAFGAALGLSVTSPNDGQGLSVAAFAIAAGLYLLWVQVMSFYMGGYVAGRLRARAPAASEHEVDVRDGLHGLLVWAIGVIAAAMITFLGVGGIGSARHAPQSALAADAARVADQRVEALAAPEQAAAPHATTAALSERKVEIERKLTIISAFVSAASLLVGAVAAFYGAHSGGHHRDKNVVWDFFTSRARVR